MKHCILAAEAASGFMGGHPGAIFGNNTDRHILVMLLFSRGFSAAVINQTSLHFNGPINAAEGIGPALRKYRKDAAFKCRYNEMREEIVWYFNEAETPERGPGVLSI